MLESGLNRRRRSSVNNGPKFKLRPSISCICLHVKNIYFTCFLRQFLLQPMFEEFTSIYEPLFLYAQSSSYLPFRIISILFSYFYTTNKVMFLGYIETNSIRLLWIISCGTSSSRVIFLVSLYLVLNLSKG